MACRALLGGRWGSPALSEGPGQGWATVGSEEDVGAGSLLPPNRPGKGRRQGHSSGLLGQRASGPQPEQGSWLAWAQEAHLVPPSAQDTPRACPAASENLPGATGTAGAPHPQTFVYFEQKKTTTHKIKQQKPREMGFKRQSYFVRNQMLGRDSVLPPARPLRKGG